MSPEICKSWEKILQQFKFTSVYWRAGFNFALLKVPAEQGTVEVQLYSFLISALDWGECLISRLGHFTVSERSPGSSVSPGCGIDAVDNTQIFACARESDSFKMSLNLTPCYCNNVLGPTTTIGDDSEPVQSTCPPHNVFPKDKFSYLSDNFLVFKYSLFLSEGVPTKFLYSRHMSLIHITFAGLL